MVDPQSVVADRVVRFVWIHRAHHFSRWSYARNLGILSQGAAIVEVPREQPS